MGRPSSSCHEAAQGFTRLEPDRLFFGDRLVGVESPVVALHRAALAPDVDAEVLVGRAGGMRDVETALRVGLAPVVTQANPDTDIGIRDRLSRVGGNNLEVKHAAGAPPRAGGGSSRHGSSLGSNEVDRPDQTCQSNDQRGDGEPHGPAGDAEFMTVALFDPCESPAESPTAGPSRARAPGWAVGPCRRRRRAAPLDKPRDLPSRGRRDRRTPSLAARRWRGRAARPGREASKERARTAGTGSRDSRPAARGTARAAAPRRNAHARYCPSVNLAARSSDEASPEQPGHSLLATTPGRQRGRSPTLPRHRSRASIHSVSSTFAQDCRSRATASIEATRRAMKTITPTAYPTIANAAQSIARERVEPPD